MDAILDKEMSRGGLNLHEQFQEMTRALAGRVVDAMDSSTYAYVVSEIQAIRDRGDDPTKYEAVMLYNDSAEVLLEDEQGSNLHAEWRIVIRKRVEITDVPAFLRKRVNQLLIEANDKGFELEDEDLAELSNEIAGTFAPYIKEQSI